MTTIRQDSRYPTFRGFVTVATIIGYLVAALAIGAGLLSGQISSAVGGVVAGIIIAVMSKIAQEVSLMIADIADATIDSAANLRIFQANLKPEAAAPRVATPREASGHQMRGSSDVQACISKLAALGHNVVMQGENTWEITQSSGIKMYARSEDALISLTERILKGGGAQSKN